MEGPMRLVGSIVLAFALFAAGAAPAAEPPAFAYQSSAPLEAVYGPTRTVEKGVSARSVSFRSEGRRVTGEIISGAAAGSRPGVLFVHWLGEPKTTNHTEFEKDAIALARRGATSLLIDTMWSEGEAWFDKVGISAEADLKQAAGQVVDIRRGLDLLEAQKGVDPARVALVGHDFGAMFGVLAAGADSRPRLLVLMAGVPTFSEWYLLGKKHPDREGYVRAMSALDTGPALNRAKARAVLFQFSAKDRYISAERAALFSATSILPRGAFYYDVDHSLDTPAAFADRQAWLVEQLFGRDSHG
jgi:dienelactone hydrolase